MVTRDNFLLAGQPTKKKVGEIFSQGPSRKLNSIRGSDWPNQRYKVAFAPDGRHVYLHRGKVKNLLIKKLFFERILFGPDNTTFRLWSIRSLSLSFGNDWEMNEF